MPSTNGRWRWAPPCCRTGPTTTRSRSGSTPIRPGTRSASSSPLADGADSRDEREVERGDPAGPAGVHGRYGVEGAQTGGEAAGCCGVAAAAVGEPERRLLRDRRGTHDLHPVDVVLGTR